MSLYRESTVHILVIQMFYTEFVHRLRVICVKSSVCLMGQLFRKPRIIECCPLKFVSSTHVLVQLARRCLSSVAFAQAGCVCFKGGLATWHTTWTKLVSPTWSPCVTACAHEMAHRCAYCSTTQHSCAAHLSGCAAACSCANCAASTVCRTAPASTTIRMCCTEVQCLAADDCTLV